MIGKNMKDVLRFLRTYSGWHAYSQDKTTKRAISSLVKLGLVEINRFNQMKLKI